MNAAPRAAAQVLLSHCSPGDLVALLGAQAEDILYGAIVALGMKGSLEHCAALAALLKHESAEVVGLAENSLWRIWLRSGSNSGNAELARAVGLIKEQRFAEAVDVLDTLLAGEPDLAEAHNQRGIALCFLDRLDEAADAFRQAVQRNRYHFAAVVSLGHTYAQQGQLQMALHHYRQALALHPRLEGIAEVVERLDAIAGQGSLSR